MKTKNIFVSAFIFVMAALLVTPLMAQNNTYRVDPDVLDSEVEEYHELAEGRSALLITAAKTGKLWKVKLLLATGAKVNAVNSNDKTALMYAAENGHDKVVDRLLQEENIDVNMQDNEGKTALMYAAISLDKEIVNKLMVDGKANRNLRSHEGLTAYDYAEKEYLTLQKIQSEATEEEAAKINEELAKIEEIMNMIKPLNRIEKATIQKIANSALILGVGLSAGAISGEQFNDVSIDIRFDR